MAIKRFEDAETAIKQELEDLKNAEKAGFTTRKSEKLFDMMLNTFGDSVTYLECSDIEEHREDEEDNAQDTELCKLSKDEEPGWVIGAISKTIKQ